MPRGTPGNQGSPKKNKPPSQPQPWIKPQSNLQRSTLEAYAGIALAITVALWPMTWWLKAVLVLVLAGIAVDIARHSKVVSGASWFSRLLIILACLSLVAGLGWKPVMDQYALDNPHSTPTPTPPPAPVKEGKIPPANPPIDLDQLAKDIAKILPKPATPPPPTDPDVARLDSADKRMAEFNKFRLDLDSKLGEQFKSVQFNVKETEQEKQGNLFVMTTFITNQALSLYEQVYRSGLMEIRAELVKEAPGSTFASAPYDHPRNLNDLRSIYTDLQNLIEHFRQQLISEGKISASPHK